MQHFRRDRRLFPDIFDNVKDITHDPPKRMGGRYFRDWCRPQPRSTTKLV